MRGSRHNGEIGKVATGLAVGLLVGAGLALLFAPRPGADTRRRMARSLSRARLRGADAWDDLRFELGRARRRFTRAGHFRELDRVDA